MQLIIEPIDSVKTRRAALHVPLRIDFGEGRVRVVRMMISGAETVQEVLLPSEAIGITLNAFEAVLAVVADEAW